VTISGLLFEIRAFRITVNHFVCGLILEHMGLNEVMLKQSGLMCLAYYDVVQNVMQITV